MPKNENAPDTILESRAPAPDSGSLPGGCSGFRLGLVLSALQKKLAQAGSEEERAEIEAEIDSLEAEMGF